MVDSDTLHDIDQCVPEPIHITGHIQSHGVLFAHAAGDQTLRLVSLRPLGLGDDLRIGLSIGVGQLARAALFSAALREADAHLYRCKSTGKNANIYRAASWVSSISRFVRPKAVVYYVDQRRLLRPN